MKVSLPLHPSLPGGKKIFKCVSVIVCDNKIDVVLSVLSCIWNMRKASKSDFPEK